MKIPPYLSPNRIPACWLRIYGEAASELAADLALYAYKHGQAVARIQTWNSDTLFPSDHDYFVRPEALVETLEALAWYNNVVVLDTLDNLGEGRNIAARANNLKRMFHGYRLLPQTSGAVIIVVCRNRSGGAQWRAWPRYEIKAEWEGRQIAGQVVKGGDGEKFLITPNWGL